MAFNDLAIIKVKEPFQFRENVVPICSPLSSPEYGSPDIYDPHRCLATGWGKDAYSKKILNIRLLKMHKKLHCLWFSTPNWAGFYLSWVLIKLMHFSLPFFWRKIKFQQKMFWKEDENIFHALCLRFISGIYG